MIFALLLSVSAIFISSVTFFKHSPGAVCGFPTDLLVQYHLWRSKSLLRAKSSVHREADLLYRASIPLKCYAEQTGHPPTQDLRYGYRLHQGRTPGRRVLLLRPAGLASLPECNTALRQFLDVRCRYRKAVGLYIPTGIMRMEIKNVHVWYKMPDLFICRSNCYAGNIKPSIGLSAVQSEADTHPGFTAFFRLFCQAGEPECFGEFLPVAARRHLHMH
jgi:hypothetical protein